MDNQKWYAAVSFNMNSDVLAPFFRLKQPKGAKITQYRGWFIFETKKFRSFELRVKDIDGYPRTITFQSDSNSLQETLKNIDDRVRDEKFK